MAESGQEIEGPGGMKLLLVDVPVDRGTETLVMEAAYSGTGGAPPLHSHPRQIERFEVLEGTIWARVGEVEQRYGAGETFEVPAATAHQLAAEGPARVRWEVQPALKTAEFFERLFGDGPGSAGEAADFADFLTEFSDEFELSS